MSSIAIKDVPARGGNLTAAPPLPESERKPVSKKELAADHPTWCPGCGDFSVLALYFKLIEKRQLWHEKIATIAGIGCSSRFPYFVQAHGVHYIHGRALPFASGATFVARTTHTNPNHVLLMMEAAMDHDGFSFVECLSECVEFYPGAFDSSNPRKGGAFNLVPETHDVTDEIAAYKLADEPFPGKFGIFYKVHRPTKNTLEAGINAKAQERVKGLKDWQILQQNFNKMK